jgi:hypothetical protein
MLHRIHQKLGTAGFIISIVALVAALSGGAYAASGGLTGKEKKEVAKIAKKYSGKPGAAGPAGATGPTGPTGPGGSQGSSGSQGTAGTAGTAGKNGERGAPGKEGNPWTDGGTLPPGATETGVFGMYPNNPPGSIAALPISFPIPLTAAPEAIFVAESELHKSGCPGEVGGIPQAEPGKLCIYVDFRNATEPTPNYPLTGGLYHGVPEGVNPLFGEQVGGVSPVGALLGVQCEAGEFCSISGTWAVTEAEE